MMDTCLGGYLGQLLEPVVQFRLWQQLEGKLHKDVGLCFILVSPRPALLPFCATVAPLVTESWSIDGKGDMCRPRKIAVGSSCWFNFFT